MILIAEDGISFETYMNVHTLWTRHQSRTYQNKHPNTVQRICWIGRNEGDLKPEFSTMSEGELLYIAAHGEKDRVGLFTAEKLAEYLINRGLKASIGGIKLLACRSALPHNPLNKMLATQLFQQSDEKIDLNVSGFPGDMTRNMAGKFRTMPDGHSSELDEAIKKDQTSFKEGFPEAENEFILKVLGYNPSNQEELLITAKSVTIDYCGLGPKFDTLSQEDRRSLEQVIDNHLIGKKVTLNRLSE